MLWFTSDTHAWHTNIINYCKRPFINANHMTEEIAKNINEEVSPNDILVHLGDFSFGGNLFIEGFRSMINCDKVILVYGNHDEKIRKNEKLRNKLFHSADDIVELSLGSTNLFCCHYPMISWKLSNRGSIHLHGHCHGNLQHYMERRIDVGVDVHNYRPISIDQIIKIIEKRKEHAKKMYYI